MKERIGWGFPARAAIAGLLVMLVMSSLATVQPVAASVTEDLPDQESPAEPVVNDDAPPPPTDTVDPTAATCKELQIAYLGAIVEALDYEKAGDQKMYEFWFDTANTVGQKAVKKKCPWARG